MSDELTIREYQEFVDTAWISDDSELEKELKIVYGMMGELGEIAELNKKFMRDGGDPKIWRAKLIKEFGDHMFYFVTYMNFFDVDVREVLAENVLKVIDQHERGVVNGSGDNR